MRISDWSSDVCSSDLKDAHLPAYRKAGFTVAGLYDHDRARAEALASEWGIDTVFDTLEQAAAADAAFDVAAPPVAHVDILSALPEGAAVLLQKPMGLDLAAATAIRDVCRARRLTASVTFQLRYSAMMLAVADAIARGQLGELVEIDRKG